jgi:hypothetical protein
MSLQISKLSLKFVNHSLKLSTKHLSFNTERKEFFEVVYPFILTKDCKIFGGDFNCIINSKLDKVQYI